MGWQEVAIAKELTKAILAKTSAVHWEELSL
jgi:hypothetical protein